MTEQTAITNPFTRTTVYANRTDASILINRKPYTLPAGTTFSFTGEFDKRTGRAAFVINPDFVKPAAISNAIAGTTFRTAAFDKIADVTVIRAEIEAATKKSEKPAKEGKTTRSYNKYEYPAEITTRAARKAYRRAQRKAKKAANNSNTAPAA